MTPPDVFHHTDFRRYLEDWFAWKKSCNKRYSHRAFARRLGTNDPSLLVNIVKGRRRLPARLLDGFVQVLGLEGEAEAYFRVLVRLGQAKDEAARQRAWAELADLRSRLEKPAVDAERLRYVSDRLYPTVKELAGCEGFQDDPAWIGRRLRPEVGAEAAAEALALLEHLGLLVREDGRVRVVESALRTDTTVENLGTLEYHAQNLDLAREVLDEVRVSAPRAEETAFLGVTVAVPSERLGELRQLLYEHFGQVLHQCEGWSDRDRVVQLNVQMFPVSEPTKE